MAAALPIMQVLSAGAGILSAVKGMKGGPKAPQAKVAPTADSKAQKRAGQMATQRKYGASGRSGTILSEGTTLG